MIKVVVPLNYLIGAALVGVGILTLAAYYKGRVDTLESKNG